MDHFDSKFSVDDDDFLLIMNSFAVKIWYRHAVGFSC